MISETDLLRLRYQVKDRPDDNDNLIEFVHQDSDERSYLVKLRKGEVNIVYPPIYSITKRPCFVTNRVEELIAWHYHY